MALPPPAAVLLAPAAALPPPAAAVSDPAVALLHSAVALLPSAAAPLPPAAAAERLRVPMPLASLVHDRLQMLIARGGEQLDWSAIGKLAAKDAGL